MGSTDVDAPPLKLILAAIIIVVGLHVLTAVALVAIKTPEIKVEPKKETPPIEIEMVTLPVEKPTPKIEAKEIPPKEMTPKAEPKPPQKVTSQPKPKAVAKPIAKTVKPVAQKQKVQPKPIDKVKETKPIITKKQPEQATQPESSVNRLAEEQQRKLIAAQAEKAAQEAQRLADAKAAQVKADAKKAQETADAKTKAEADAKAAKAAADEAREKAAAQAAAAASNTPVNFTATNANWASPPSISFPTSAARRAKSGDRLTVVLVLRVNKQGGIDNVRVAQSSGNKLLDKEAQRQVRSGKFKPFTKGGVPVVGNVTLPIDYVVP